METAAPGLAEATGRQWRDAATADAAFAEVFAAHARDAVRLATLLTGDPHRAEDVVGEAFARVYVRWRRGGILDARAYVRRAVVNQVRNTARRGFLERREAARRHGDLRGPRAHDDDVVERDEVDRLLALLTHRQRTAIVLRYWEDLPEAAVAAAMGCPVGTVKSLVSRGLARLRDARAGDGQEVAT